MAGNEITSELGRCRNDFGLAICALAEADCALDDAKNRAAATEAKAIETAKRLNALMLAGKILVKAVFTYDNPEQTCVRVLNKDVAVVQENPAEFIATDIEDASLQGIYLSNKHAQESLVAEGHNFKLTLDLLAPEPSKPEWLTDEQAKKLLVFIKIEQMYSQATSKNVHSMAKIEKELQFMRNDYMGRSLPELEALIVTSGITLEDAYSRNIAIEQ